MSLAQIEKTISNFGRRAREGAASLRLEEERDAELGEVYMADKQSPDNIINSEVGPPLRQLAATLKDVVERAHRPWDAWLTHAATAVVSGICSAVLVIYFLGR